MCQKTNGEYFIESVHRVRIIPSVKLLLRRYDWVDPQFDPLEFPSSLNIPTEVSVGLMYFGYGIYVEDRDVRMAANGSGLRLLDVAGLLSLGNQYPDLQFNHPILSLEPLWVDEEKHCHAAYIHAGPPGRCVKFSRVRFGWTGAYRFAAILP